MAGLLPQEHSVTVPSPSADTPVPKWRLALGLGAAGLSGLLLALSLPPFGLHALAWVALVPWLAVMPRLSPRATWLLGTCLGLVFYRVSLGWLFGIHPVLGGAMIVSLAALLGLAFRATALTAKWLGPAAMFWSIPLFMTGEEVLRSEGLSQFRFAYAAVGYTQAANPWVAQIASLGGVYGLTLLVVASNAAVAFAFQRRTARSCLPAAGVAAVIVALGALSQPTARVGGRDVVVACVQTESEDDREILDLTNRAADSNPPPEIIVLPEHTLVGDADRPHPVVKKLSEIARTHRAYLCVGVHVRASADQPCDYDNVALVIGPGGEIVGKQAKSVPIPFFHDGNPARSQRVFETPQGMLGAAVCFDADFTDISRRVVAMGAELVLVPVMNPERWPAAQRQQQAEMARLRSIESRRCAVRAASSGISQVIDAEGRIVAQRVQAEGPGVLLAKAYFNGQSTLFCRGGHYVATVIGWLFLAGVVVLTVAPWVRRAESRGGLIAAGCAAS